MKVHRLSLGIPNFNWVSGNQKKQERLICEALLKMRMPEYDNKATFETPKGDPPDVIIWRFDGLDLRVEVTERVPYERRSSDQANGLVKALKQSLLQKQVSAPAPCNIVLSLHPELKSKISKTSLLNQTETFTQKIHQFLQKNDVSSEHRILQIFDGDISITFIPAFGNFRTDPAFYVNNINIACWDGIFLETVSDSINKIISKKDKKLRQALKEKGNQSKTDILVIWNTNPVELLNGLHMQIPHNILYTGIYYLFINNIENDYFVSLEILRETSKEKLFFTNVNIVT